jgi:hypothetical protein
MSQTATAVAYAATYIVEAPAHTLESITAELLPLAHAAGFEGVALNQYHDSLHGSHYTAHAVLGAKQGFEATALVGGVGCKSLDGLRDAAQETLYTITGKVSAHLS